MTLKKYTMDRLMVLAHNERNGNAVSVGSDAFFQGYNGRATESFSYSDEVVVVKNKRKAVNCMWLALSLSLRVR